MIKLLEKVGDRMLSIAVPSITARAATPCDRIPIPGCAWICCNTTCTVEKKCCWSGLVCVCSACQHS
jgi:hypothetical protein